MTNDFRGYGGNASEVDNFDWYTPVEQEPLDYLGFPPGGNYVDQVFVGDYLKYNRSDLGLGSGGPNPSGLGNYTYNGGDMLAGLNDALNAQIAADIQRQISAQIQAQLLADAEFLKATAAIAEAERQRLAAEAAEAERKRQEAAEAEKVRLAAIEAERLAKEKAALALEAEKKRLAGIEAERLAKEKAALALAEAEKQKLAAIEAQKVADAAKVKSDVIVTPKPIAIVESIVPVKATEKLVEVVAPIQKTATKSDNTMVIGGILLALVGVYIITKD